MIACEYVFGNVNSLGSDDYLDECAVGIDQMVDRGWEILECTRRPGADASWTVVLHRPAHTPERNRAWPDIF